MLIKFTVNLRGATRRDEQANVFLAFCPALNVYSQGRDEKEARKALESTIMLYLETCLERKLLESVLARAGFSRISETLLTPHQLCEEYIKIEKAKFEHVFDMDIPIQLVATQGPHNAGRSSRAPSHF